MPVDEVQESNAQWVDWAKRRAASTPGSDVRELPGITVAWCGGDLRLTNSVFLSRPIENARDLEARVRTLSEFLADKSGMPNFVACQNWIPAPLRGEADDLLAIRGLRAKARSKGMTAEGLLAAAADLPPLTYRPIGDDETQLLAADINSAAHGFSLAAGRAVMVRGGRWGEDFWGYLAYSDGEPVATCAVLLLNGCLHVLRLATMPGLQRRGFGEAVMRRALATAENATGLTRSTLHSTAAGDALYRRLGYRAVADFVCYSR